MKILVVSPPTFGAAVGGAAKDIYGTIELLNDMGHEVHLYVIGTRGQDDVLIKEFSATHGVPVHVFMPVLNNWMQWLWWVLFKSFGYVDRASYVFGQLIEDATFLKHVEKWKPDRMMFFCSYGWPIAQFARKQSIPCVFRSHNYEPDFFWEALTHGEMANPLNWVRYAAKIVGERSAARFSDVIASIPFDGVRHYREWGHTSIFILTLTYPFRSLRDPWVHAEKTPLHVFYLGASYRVRFHLRGAQELIEHIAPEVERRAPGQFVFHICGAKLPASLQKMCDGKRVIYEGYVPDLEKFMDEMDIGAFPVYTGTSMKGKVFESLCRAFPVVIPTNCLGGYDLVHDKEVLMAENTKEFVRAIMSLADERTRHRLSAGAAAFSSKLLGKDTLLKTLSTVLSVTK
jgi:hypothetical protein